MLTRAWGLFDKSELSKFIPRFSTMAIAIESLITADFYPHGHNTLKGPRMEFSDTFQGRPIHRSIHRFFLCVETNKEYLIFDILTL